MARCEDFPCCGHELGCCPDYDESGRQLNMKCVCGATVPLSSRSSLCESCLRDPDDPYYDEENRYYDDEYDDDDDDYEYDEELARDQMLAQQELEDFEQADEYFGYYGDSEY